MTTLGTKTILTCLSDTVTLEDLGIKMIRGASTRIDRIHAEASRDLADAVSKGRVSIRNDGDPKTTVIPQPAHVHIPVPQGNPEGSLIPFLQTLIEEIRGLRKDLREKEWVSTSSSPTVSSQIHSPTPLPSIPSFIPSVVVPPTKVELKTESGMTGSVDDALDALKAARKGPR